MSLDEINSRLMGSGKPTISWKDAPIGTVVKGKILDGHESQQTDFHTREPLVWKDGQPRMQIVLTLATDMRDPAVDGDDGERQLFVKGQMQKAVGEAVRKAGVTGLAAGGTLAVQFSGLGEATGAGLNPPKVFVAQYAPPAINAGADLL